MKKLLILAVVGFAGIMAGKAQTFSDGFETYNVGKLAVQATGTGWTTWDNNPGSATDADVVTTDAHAGTKSLYFASTVANGGPTDCVLKFGGPYTSGQFTFSAWFKVETGKGAYFNFQGTNTMGQKFVMNCQMDEKNNLVLSDGKNTPMITTTYTSNTWFQLTIDINLNINDWKLLIDGVSKGSFQNPDNQVAAIDIYPVNASNSQAGYWVDDVSYTAVPYSLPNRNGAVTSLNLPAGLAGQQRLASVTVRNLGTQAMSSFDVTLNYNGIPVKQTVTGVNIASYASSTVNFTAPITLVAGSKPVTATVSNVNGTAADDDATDDSKSITINPIVPAPGKMVFAEEGTGTWCQWCPRGAVAMKDMAAKYPGYYQGISVHNSSSDPMRDSVYDVSIGFSSFPGAMVDRGSVIDPSGIEQDFFQRITSTPKATMVNTAQYNSTTHVLNVSVATTFKQAISGTNFNIVCVLTEDSVTGKTSKYSQSNAYSGGANGPMGGFESLPNPVPYSKMVYDDVARDIQPSFLGLTNAFPSTINVNDVVTTTFTFTLKTTWRMNKMHVISMLIDPAGKIDNGATAPMSQALGVINVPTMDGGLVNIYPNPTIDGHFTLQLNDNKFNKISVFNLLGKEVYNKVAASNSSQIDLSAQPAGVYLLKLTGEGGTVTKKITITK